ncbi:TBC domain-containing protein [Daldinia bambusicola]|nr:TBC domain-containing protein [Daldinia bambusicola]
MLDHAIMTYGGAHLDGVDLALPSPGSPPGMTSSAITSRASSVRSFNSDDGEDGITADIAHFEEIGLDDDVTSLEHSHFRDTHAKLAPNPYSISFASDLRGSVKHVGPKIHPQTRDLAHPRPQLRSNPSFSGSRTGAPTLTPQFRDTNTRNISTAIGPEPQAGPLPTRGLSVRSSSSIAVSRHRSPSPNVSARSLSPRDNNLAVPKLRRSSSQTSRAPKSIIELEKECDDDDDNIPDDLILDNVPLSPRPPMERSASRPSSTTTSPERKPKERIRSVGNGTPPVAVHQGCLKSPTWRTDSSPSTESQRSSASSSTKGRAKSWTAAISELSPEAKALTEKLEEHADELDKHGVYHATYERPAPKPRVKSALAELPPLRRSNIMIDPLPISKEKEAVLSRTRPSWLPPKDPAEEKKHLREYQRMIANSIEADKKREAAKKEKERNKDIAAKALTQVWENDVLKRWDVAIRERRTRELWWKGIAPRSRGVAWSRAIGNQLGLTETSFEAALARAHEVEKRSRDGKPDSEDERKMSWFAQIKADVEEQTWVDLKIFQTGGPLHKSLIDVLRAYAMYRSDIGYVSGCSTIAAILLLNLPTPAATFIALANILNRPLLFSFYASDVGAKTSAFNLLLQTLAKKSPKLHEHLTNQELGIEPDGYLGGIFTSCFTRNFSLDECTRIWDVYVFEGDAVLVRAAVALLLDREASLLSAKTTAEVRDIIDGRSKSDEQEKVDAWMTKVRDAGKS